MNRRRFLHAAATVSTGVAAATAGCASGDSNHPPPIVATTAGRVRGTTTVDGYAFKGIPYAAPPHGTGRYLPPRPVTPWQGVRDTVTDGPTPPQPATPPPLEFFAPPIPGAEYLNLNIWTPDPGRSRLPVLVWIYGGGFDTGTVGLYDGSAFARDGVVFVAINYRLGAEGYLYLGDGVANVALLDQIAALHWVHDNIAAFGGDPDNVTIAGQSAGAMAVGTLMTMPRAAGLFRRAIMESGAGNLCYSADTAHEIGTRLAGKLAVAPTRDAVAGAGVDRILAAQLAVMDDLARQPDPQRWGGEPGCRVNMWRPTLDAATLPARPIDAARAGAGADVDVLLGHNGEEGRLSLVPFRSLDSVTHDELTTAMRLYRLPVDRAVPAYRAAYPGTGAGELLAILQGDWMYTIPGLRSADTRSGMRASTYAYEFAWRSPQFDGRLGSCHFLEVPFVFDQLHDERMQWITGPNPPQHLADLVHRTWVQFIGTGRVDWPRYDTARRATMRFDIESAAVHDPYPTRKIWEGVDLY
ncbi:carboxylesterase/lipase family protein [Nocardia vermiculata]|uniref:Carboxylic ester hydrolase n=1 Tax=Nocardia vermiculata TaxID=257274 RepID=A0A846XUC6_9NOCA|nr:carboxylesterase family protein [Nocardia vermiculata]NKY50736.1 carboxylesterase/lipase family protein [Nocardia vermiculata]